MQGEKYHLLGIGGIGMSGLARALMAQGCAVSGSDVRGSALTDALAREGAKVFIGHRPENLNGPSAVVISAAIAQDNPELDAARRRGLPIMGRGELLGRLMERERGIAVTGTHGKTTTTGMLAVILIQAGRDPTVLLGGEMNGLVGNTRVGSSGLFLAEACEAYDSFLSLHPEVAVITNVEPDHLDYFHTFERLLQSFHRFAAGVKPGGVLIGCGDDPVVVDLLRGSSRRTLCYGLGAHNRLRAEEIEPQGLCTRFQLCSDDAPAIPTVLSVPGRQNVINALGAIAAAHELGVPMADAAAAIREFRGVGRRFEILADVGGVQVVDDYAHHPTEVRATLDAARSNVRPHRLIAVFQPHLYSRTEQFLDQFAASFEAADELIVTEVYAAREAGQPGVSGRVLADRAAVARGGRATEYVPDMNAIVQQLAGHVEPGDLVITLGAGDIRTVAEQLAARLRAR